MVTLLDFIHRLRNKNHLVQRNKQYRRKTFIQMITHTGFMHTFKSFDFIKAGNLYTTGIKFWFLKSKSF